MWTFFQSIWPAPHAPTPRIPTSQSPIPAFFFSGRRENSQSSLPHATEGPRWRTPWPPTSQELSPMPTFSLLERPETPVRFTGRPNIDQQNYIPLNQWLRNIPDSKFRTCDPLDDPPKSQGFQPQHFVPQSSMLFSQGPTHNRPKMSNIVDARWNNPNIWPIVPLLNARKDTTLTGINRKLESGEIPRIWKTRNPHRYIALPAVHAQLPTAYFNIETSPLLSPLSIPFPEEPIPFPQDRELWLKFGGDTALGWNTLKPSVDKFINQGTWDSDHRLTVTWLPSSPEVDLNGWRGGRTFKLFFNRLEEQAVLALFKSISINVPENFEETDVGPITGLERTLEEQTFIDADKIDLASASNIKELFLQGSHLYFAEKLLLPLEKLTLLSITRCQISVNDVLAILQACFCLKEVHVETVRDKEHCELGDRFALKPGAEFRSRLRLLTITSAADVSRILGSLMWEHDDPRITIDILDDNVARQSTGAFLNEIPSNAFLTLKGNFLQSDMDTLCGVFRNGFTWRPASSET